MAAGDAVLKPGGSVFVPGVVCGAYLASVVGDRPQGAKPDATAAATATVASDGTVTFSGRAQAQHFLAPKPQSSVQRLTVNATAGQFRLRYGEDTTHELAFNISAANLKTALQGLPSIGSGQIATVTGGPGDAGGTTPYVITFGGTLANQDVETLEVLDGATPLSGGGATAAVAEITAGRPGGDSWVGFRPDAA